MLAYFLEHGSHNKVARVDKRVCNNLEMHIPVRNPDDVGIDTERCVGGRTEFDLKLRPLMRQ